MSVRIEIVDGPDKGRVLRLRSNRLVIGRGVGTQERLNDPLIAGQISIEYRDGATIVEHNLSHAIYLNSEPLAARTAKVWFAGHKLQPTAQTVLLLLSESAAPTVNTSATPMWQWVAAIAMLVIGSAVLVFAPSRETTNQGVTAGSLLPAFEQLRVKLQELKPTDPTLVAFLPRLSRAVADDRRGAAPAALVGYQWVREAADQLLARAAQKPADVPENALEPIRQTRALANDRIIALDRFNTRGRLQ